jgi:hypothetical protein
VRKAGIFETVQRTIRAEGAFKNLLMFPTARILYWRKRECGSWCAAGRDESIENRALRAVIRSDRKLGKTA